MAGKLSATVLAIGGGRDACVRSRVHENDLSNTAGRIYAKADNAAIPRRHPSTCGKHSGIEAHLHQEEFVDFLDRVEDLFVLYSSQVGEGYRPHEPLANVRRERIVDKREKLLRLNRKLCSKGIDLCL